MAQIPKGRLVKGPCKPIYVGTVPSTFQFTVIFPEFPQTSTWGCNSRFWLPHSQLLGFGGYSRAAYCFGCGYIFTYFVATRNDVLNFKSHGVCYIIHSFLEHEEMEWDPSGSWNVTQKTRTTWIFNCVNPCLRDSKSKTNFVSNAREHPDRILSWIQWWL